MQGTKETISGSRDQQFHSGVDFISLQLLQVIDNVSFVGLVGIVSMGDFASFTISVQLSLTPCDDHV